MSRATLLALALVSAGCSSTVPATATIVEVDAEGSVQSDVSEVTIVVRGMGADGTAAVPHEDVLRGAEITWPVRATIAPEGGDSTRRFSFEATARDASGAVVGTVRATSGFIARRTLLLHLVIEECCRGMACEAAETCTSCGCSAADVDVTSLSDFDPRVTRGDAGAVDVGFGDGSAPDGGQVDASANDTSANDAGTDANRDAYVPRCHEDAECVMPGAEHQRAACVDGLCTYDCDDGWDDCNDDVSDGCEASLDSLANCGACHAACTVPSGTGTCADRTCRIASCNPGRADCDTIVSTGCEVDTTIDPAHCGSCTTSCAATASTTACVASTCAIVSCDAGHGDCDGAAATGCEGDTTTFANCGACGRSCALRGTTRECRSSTCEILGCMTGYTDCSAAVEGCEAYLATDRNNCGACGRVCGGAEWCSNGGCCPLGFDYCPGVGCVNLASDNAHCGSCTTACTGGLRCFDYDCVP